MAHAEEFLVDAEKKVFDAEHRRKLNFNIAQYDKKVIDGKKGYSNLDLARTRLSVLKTKTIENLDKYLIEWEANFIKRGGKVIWAQDADEAMREVHYEGGKNQNGCEIKIDDDRRGAL
jgi:L-lactate dehydrogenase complex protein LldF